MIMFNSFKDTRANDRVNEIKALFFIEKGLLDEAEKILCTNIKSETASPLTYDLLIKIYEHTQNYSSLIITLNSGIRRTVKKDFYRKLKKQIILSKLFKDMDSVN